jgi:alpha-galactosidase
MENKMLAATPPMGWNSWGMFGVHITADIVKETADAFVSSGLREAGYEYVVIDDVWHGGRDDHGVLYPCPRRFPDGMKALADHVHSRGLKFGLYSDAGTLTCA